ncbi:MAG: hypothetical protein V4735_01815 [Pseudomonadota bacterium]
MSSSRYHSQNSDRDDALGKDDAKAALQRSIEQGVNDLQRHQYSDDPDKNTAKLFGLFEMDSGVVKMIEGLWAGMSGEITRTLSPRLYKTVFDQGLKIKIADKMLSETALHRTAAGVTLGVNLGIFVGGSAVKLCNDMVSQHRARADVARHMAPVLDDLMGKHSVGTYNSVRATDNSVIWAHRQRVGKEASALNSGTVLSAVGNNMVNFVGQGMNVRSLWTGKHREAIFLKMHEKEAGEMRERLRAYEERHGGHYDRGGYYGAEQNEARAAAAAKRRLEMDAEIEKKVAEDLHQKHDNEAGRMGALGLNMLLPTLLGKVTESKMNRLKKSRQPYSAWEMISCLSEQLQNNPGGDNRFQLPGQRGQELPLEKYVAEIFKQHQREMCDLDANYSELRQSLHEDLDALVKPIAEALRGGKLNPLMLVRLAGEQKVIKNYGRGLASATDVKTTLESYEGKSHRMNTVDPKEYLSGRNFDLPNVKESLQSLKGEEKLDYAASFPDGVLKAAGEDEQTIKSVQLHRAKLGYKQMLRYKVSALAAKSDEDLKAGGLGTAQIDQLRKGEEMLADRGLDAFEALLGSPTHADGIENVVADFVVPKLVGDKTYLGTLIENGRSLVKDQKNTDSALADKEEPADKDEARAAEMAEAALARAKSGNHAKREHQTAKSGHAKREEHRRTSAQDAEMAVD